MPKVENDHSRSKVNQVLGVAKKLSHLGLQKLNQPSRVQLDKDQSSVVQTQNIVDNAQNSNPQSILRAYVPNVSQQLLGRHYGKISQVASFVSPIQMNQVADYFFDRLNQFSEKMAGSQAILDQAGVKSLEQLSQNVERSDRISQALIEQNKWIATAQGGISGALGVIGSGIDIPCSVFFALRTVYQTGRAYGFELGEDQKDIVEFVFKELPLEDIAEKQSLILAIRSFSTVLETHDIEKLQSLVGSTNDIDWLKNLFGHKNEQQSSNPSYFAFLAHFTPLVTMGVSANYSWKLIEHAGSTAQAIFSTARSYLLKHPEEKISVLEAYQYAQKQHTALTQLSVNTEESDNIE